jgi:hypothetical protein
MQIESERPWPETIRAQVDPHEYLFKSKISYDEVRAIHAAIWEKIKTESADHPLKEHLFTNGDFEMAGVAVVAAYLKSKHGLDHLYVCKSLEAFQAQLHEIGKMPDDIRVALILPDEPEDVDEPLTPDYGAETSHKITALIEKKGEFIKIALLDSTGTTLSDRAFQNIQTEAAELNHLPDGVEAALWYIYRSGLNLNTTEVYYYKPCLQEARYGCETFALKNSLYFLRTPEFFDQITTDKFIQIPAKGGDLTVKTIDRLPPVLLKGTQALGIAAPVPKHHQLEIEKGNPYGTVTQNYYINHQSLKYHLIALRALKILTQEEIEKLLFETLITVLRPPRTPGQPPQTLSDVAPYRHYQSLRPEPAS